MVNYIFWWMLKAHNQGNHAFWQDLDFWKREFLSGWNNFGEVLCSLFLKRDKELVINKKEIQYIFNQLYNNSRKKSTYYCVYIYIYIYRLIKKNTPKQNTISVNLILLVWLRPLQTKILREGTTSPPYFSFPSESRNPSIQIHYSKFYRFFFLEPWLWDFWQGSPHRA